MRRPLVALLVVNAILPLGALAWLTWINHRASPVVRRAYSEKGPPATPVHEAPEGPQGPAGPVGPDAEEAIPSLSVAIDDLETRLADLEAVCHG